MAESIKHLNLVKILFEKIDMFISINEKSFVLIDKPDAIQKPTRTIDGFVPDLYYCYNNKLIIGEAKTELDVCREHSLNQYESYYKEAMLYKGEAILVFAVPWNMVNKIKNIIKGYRIKYKNNVKAYVSNEIGDIEEI